MGASGHCYRSAPVLGRSRIRKQTSVEIRQRPRQSGACCARGRAHSGPTAPCRGSVVVVTRCAPSERVRAKWLRAKCLAFFDWESDHGYKPFTQLKSMKRKKVSSSAERAFTRLELAVVLATLGLLAGIALPGLAVSRVRSEQVNCASNLRQVGHGVQLWASDHGDRTPWVTPESEGGTRGSTSPLRQNPWFQIGWMSNELVTPKILICPSDQLGAPRKMANDFSSGPGGFFNLSYRNNALSYILGLHAVFELSRNMLSGDRNLRFNAINISCSLGFMNTALLNGGPSLNAWTNSIHGTAGNLLFSDGSVEELSSAGLRQVLADPRQNDNESYHFLVPP